MRRLQSPFSPNNLRGISLGQQLVPGLRERRSSRITASSSATLESEDSEASLDDVGEVEGGDVDGSASPFFFSDELLLLLFFFCLEIFTRAALLSPLSLLGAIVIF